MIKLIIKLIRPQQWTKNAFCFAGVMFGGRIHEPHSILLAFFTFMVFSAASSSAYVLNDIMDRERDCEHPKKCTRPIASGAISVPVAASIGLLMATVGFCGGYALGVPTLACLILYLINNAAYSLYLKHATLLDAISIAFGFVLRLLAGIYVLGDLPTAWIVLCTFFLSLFLSFAKRRAEILSLADKDNFQRPVLNNYSLHYLDHLTNSSATMALLCYALFTILSGKTPDLIITLPIVYYGIMHYQQLIMVRGVGEEPDQILLKNWGIKLCLLLWILTYYAVLHWNPKLFR